MTSAHTDTFARDNLPPKELQPDFLFTLPELQFPEQLNCATELLDKHITEGRGDRVCIRAKDVCWTYRDLQERANRIAHVLTREMGLVSGNRVLLHAPNTPMMAACWFGIIKAGGIAVATMPLLRAKELKPILEIGKISHALCDASLATEMRLAALESPDVKTRFAGMMAEPVPTTPEQFGDLMRREHARYESVVKASGATVD